MPGPRNKPKRKLKVKKERVPPPSASQIHMAAPEAVHAGGPCLTLLVNEDTLCWRTATQGATRCNIHHGQFRILYRRYTDAASIVDKMNKDRLLPTHEEIMGYTDWRAALEKGRLVRQYIDAVRVETEGRHLHAGRFGLEGEQANV